MTLKNATIVCLFVVFVTACGESQPPSATKPKVDIVLRTSRSQVTAGSGFGLNADITNNSDQAVYLVPRYATMTPPPELDPTGGNWSANIPGAQPLRLDDDDYWQEPVRLGPGDTTTAFWSSRMSRPDEGTKWFPNFRLSDFRLINFTPGEYTIKVNILVWPDEASARTPPAKDPKDSKEVRGPAKNNYETQTAQIKVIVVAPQWVILTGAVIGGLIAYFLLPKVRIKPDVINFWGIATAALLSSIVTILLARVSETQFLVRVTINDVWGAIAMGFITSSSGVAILNRYDLTRFDKSRREGTGERGKEGAGETPSQPEEEKKKKAAAAAAGDGKTS